MYSQKNRYQSNNLHSIICGKDALIYDVPTNTIYKVGIDLAKQIRELQDSSEESYKILEHIQDIAYMI